MAETEFKYDVFISYSHKDEEWADKVLRQRLDDAGFKVCIDYRDFDPGNMALLNMQDAAKKSRHVVLVLTRNWLKSEWSLFEALMAATKDPAGLQRKLIPLLCEAGIQNDINDFIAMRTWADFTRKDREEVAWQSLFRSIRDNEESTERGTTEQKQLAKAIATYKDTIKSQVELAETGEAFASPYKALLEYDIRDAFLFFGRDDDVKRVLGAINDSRLTVLHSKSGSGKTSLLKAGVRPQLFASGHLPIFVRPQSHPVDLAIKRAILPQLENSPVWLKATLQDFLREIISLLQGTRLIIILDQFEEIFTLQSQADRAKFSQELASCLDDDLLLPVHWVISLRGEYLSELATFDPPVTNPIDKNVLLHPLSRENAKLAIQEPARKKSVFYQDGLIELILDDLGPQKIHPPELQIICSALYEAGKDRKLITHELYESLGKKVGILQEHFNNVMNQKIPRDRVILAHQVLLSLVSSEGSRIPRSKNNLESELKSQKIDVSFLEDVLARLVDGHLLRIEEVRTSQQSIITYELAHDYLLDKIALDPISQNRKIAQELVDYKTRNFMGNEDLILSSEELAFIQPQQNLLFLNDTAQKLITKSLEKLRGRRIWDIWRNSVAASVFLLGIVLFIYSRIIVPIITSPPPQTVVIVSGGVNLIYFFWMWVILFCIIGGMRGWAKELVVSFSVVLALALNHFIRHLPLVKSLSETDTSLFWARTLILAVLVYFGYQTVVSIQQLAVRAVRERLQDTLVGILMGGFNGYLISGSVLYYMHVAGYPFSRIITAPTEQNLINSINQMMLYMPPQLLGEPGIYFAVVLLFAFVVVVYI